jgi:hypothetical protein
MIKVIDQWEKRWYQLIGLTSSYSRFIEICSGLIPVKGLKLHCEPCFFERNVIIVSKHGINIGLRHNFHIIPYPSNETTVL